LRRADDSGKRQRREVTSGEEGEQHDVVHGWSFRCYMAQHSRKSAGRCRWQEAMQGRTRPMECCTFGAPWCLAWIVTPCGPKSVRVAPHKIDHLRGVGISALRLLGLFRPVPTLSASFRCSLYCRCLRISQAFLLPISHL